METGLPRTGLVEALAVIRFRNVRPNEVAGPEEAWRAIAAQAAGWAVAVPAPETALEDLPSATVLEDLASVIAPAAPVWEARAEPIASAAGIFHVAAGAAGMPSEEVPGDSTDRARAVVAVEAPPAWGLAEEASEGEAEALVVVAAAVAADKARRRIRGVQNETNIREQKSFSRCLYLVRDDRGVSGRVGPAVSAAISNEIRRREID